ncbi:MAG: LLM class flavin-dependent oxidoreductase [Gammaproteobacteria bacterium]|nr:LLM class flavin-dependent oxidoreductase [Gammaproteobacteria bacterium]
MTAPLGLLQWTEGTPGPQLVENALRLEALGYHELWLPEISGREPFATSGYLLAKTSRIKISSGIANVYAHDADSAAQAANTLAELSGGRFSLGLGVSHPVLVEPRGHTWVLPVPKMRAYLTRLRAAPIDSPLAASAAPVIVASHGPGLLKVAREMADGAFLFLQPLEAVRQARRALGPTPELHVVVRCLLETDPQKARDLARRACAFYISLPPYHEAWGRVGFSPADWSNGGSDRLIDEVCAWGDIATIRRRLDAFVTAGATHVVVYPCNPGENYSAQSALSAHWHWPLLEGLASTKT